MIFFSFCKFFSTGKQIKKSFANKKNVINKKKIVSPDLTKNSRRTSFTSSSLIGLGPLSGLLVKTRVFPVSSKNKKIFFKRTRSLLSTVPKSRSKKRIKRFFRNYQDKGAILSKKSTTRSTKSALPLVLKKKIGFVSSKKNRNALPAKLPRFLHASPKLSPNSSLKEKADMFKKNLKESNLISKDSTTYFSSSLPRTPLFSSYAEILEKKKIPISRSSFFKKMEEKGFFIEPQKIRSALRQLLGSYKFSSRKTSLGPLNITRFSFFFSCQKKKYFNGKGFLSSSRYFKTSLPTYYRWPLFYTRVSRDKGIIIKDIRRRMGSQNSVFFLKPYSYNFFKKWGEDLLALWVGSKKFAFKRGRSIEFFKKLYYEGYPSCLFRARRASFVKKKSYLFYRNYCGAPWADTRRASLTRSSAHRLLSENLLHYYSKIILKRLYALLVGGVKNLYKKKITKRARLIVKKFIKCANSIVFRAFFQSNDYRKLKTRSAKKIVVRSFNFSSKIGSKIMKFFIALNRFKFFSFLSNIFPVSVRKFLKIFLSLFKVCGSGYDRAIIPSKLRARQRKLAHINPRVNVLKKVYAGSLSMQRLAEGLFSTPTSPFVSSSHLMWAEALVCRNWFLKSIKADNFRRFPHLKKLSFGLSSSLLFSKSLFWGASYRLNRFNNWLFIRHVNAPYRDYLTQYRSIFFKAEDYINATLANKRLNIKKNFPFVLKRNSRQSFREMKHKISNIKPWSVSYDHIARKKVKFVSWDRRTRALKTSYQPRFFNPYRRFQIFSSIINRVRARQLPLKIFGKLLNTQFSNYLKFGAAEKFIDSTVANKVHPDLIFFNTTDSKSTVTRSSSVSGFFYGYSAVLQREFSNFTREKFGCSDVFTWFKKTAKMERATWKQEMRLKSYSVENNKRAPYTTAFNRFWHLNLHKIELVGVPRANNRLWCGLPMTGSSFLGTFESGVDKNFTSFYSCNKFATVKFANTLLASTGASDSLPLLRNINRGALLSFVRAKRVLNLVKKRSKWFSGKNSSTFKRYSRSSVFEGVRTLFDGYRGQTVRRIMTIFTSLINRYNLKYLWDYYPLRTLFMWSADNFKLRPFPQISSMPQRLFFGKSLLVLALLNLQKIRASAVNSEKLSIFFSKQKNIRDFTKLKKFSLPWFKHSKNLKSSIISAVRAGRPRKKKLPLQSNDKKKLRFLYTYSKLSLTIRKDLNRIFASSMKKNIYSKQYSVKKGGAFSRKSLIRAKTARQIKQKVVKRELTAPGRLGTHAVLPTDLGERYRFLLKNISPEFRIDDVRVKKTRDAIWSTWASARSIIPKGKFYRQVGDFKSYIRRIENSSERVSDLQRRVVELINAKKALAKITSRPGYQKNFKQKGRQLSSIQKTGRSTQFRGQINSFNRIVLRTAPGASLGAVSQFFYAYLRPANPVYAYIRIFTGRVISALNLISSKGSKCSKAALKMLLQKDLNKRAGFLVKRLVSRKTLRPLNILNWRGREKNFIRRRFTSSIYDGFFLHSRKWLRRIAKKSRRISIGKKRAGIGRARWEDLAKRFFLTFGLKKNSFSNLLVNAAIEQSPLRVYRIVEKSHWLHFVYNSIREKSTLRQIRADSLDSYNLFWKSSADSLGKDNSAKRDLLYYGTRASRQLPKLKFSPKNFFRNKYTKASGYFTSRFMIGDFFAQQLSEIKRYKALRRNFKKKLQNGLTNLFRTSKTLTLFKYDVEAKGRSIFIYYPQKKSWIQRRWNRPYKLISAVSDPQKYSFDEKIVAAKSIYGIRRFFNARIKARGKHWRLKVFIKHILRRKFNCSMSALKTRWRIAKETKRKWYKYFDEFESKLANILCLMGYYDDIDSSSAAITGGIIKVNNTICVNPEYRVRILDVVSVDMQAYVDMRSDRVTNIVQEFFSTSDVTHEVKRRILGHAADFIKKHAAVARLRREGFSVSRYIFFQKLLRAVVTKFNSARRFNENLKSSPKLSLNKKNSLNSKAAFSRKKSAGKKGFGEGRPLESRYSLADLGTGINFAKLTVREAPTRASSLYSPSRIRRMIFKALNDDASALSSSLEISNDIFYKYNNISIYLRRPHTINEMFEVSNIATTSTYNPYVIREFYSSRFEK